MTSNPKAPHHLAYAHDEGDLIFQLGEKRFRLSGDSVSIAKQIIERADGRTSREEILSSFNNRDEVAGVLGFLVSKGILYDRSSINVPRAAIEPFENVLAACSHDTIESILEELSEKAISLFGETAHTSILEDHLTSAGIERVKQGADMVIYAGPAGEPKSLQKANEQWLEEGGILLRAVYDPGSIEIGPVLSDDAPGCLECVQKRLESNGIDRQSFHHPHPGGSIHDSFITRLETVILRSLLENVPAYLVDRIYTKDMDTMETGVSDFLAVPGCQACER